MDSFISITLAAGNGTRMKSSTPKPLHNIAGRSILDFSQDCLFNIKKNCTRILVASENLVQNMQSVNDFKEIIIQHEKLGTGHAVMQVDHLIPQTDRVCVVINYGDTPFVRPETIDKMLLKLEEFDIVFLGFEVKNASKKYGRMVVEGEKLLNIIEYKDADQTLRSEKLCNSGIIVAKAGILKKCVQKIDDKNAAGEYYLTDIVKIANLNGFSASYVLCDETEVMGINSRQELAEAEHYYQKILRKKHFDNGVTMLMPKTVYFSYDTDIGSDVVIEQSVHFDTGVKIEAGVTVKAFCHLAGCHISSGSVIGPFARIRPETFIAGSARVGNFVEVKNSALQEGAKVNHLSYIGDAQIGENTNIGAGTITCNYDGFKKYKTIIGDEVFIGSNTAIIAPAEIESGAIVAAGSVVTSDIEEDAIFISRPDGKTLPGAAKRYRNSKKKI